MEKKKQLIKYLNSYRAAVARLEDLRRRRAQLASALNPYHGLTYDGMPKAHNVTDGMDKVAQTLDKLADIDAKLREQEQAAADYAAQILATLALLPDGSDGRRALELRFIDGVTTGTACGKLCVSDRTYWRIYHSALNDLLKFNQVIELINEMEDGKQ